MIEKTLKSCIQYMFWALGIFTYFGITAARLNQFMQSSWIKEALKWTLWVSMFWYSAYNLHITKKRIKKDEEKDKEKDKAFNEKITKFDEMISKLDEMLSKLEDKRKEIMTYIHNARNGVSRQIEEISMRVDKIEKIIKTSR